MTAMMQKQSYSYKPYGYYCSDTSVVVRKKVVLFAFESGGLPEFSGK